MSILMTKRQIVSIDASQARKNLYRPQKNNSLNHVEASVEMACFLSFRLISMQFVQIYSEDHRC